MDEELTYDTVVPRLVTEIPELCALYNEHLHDYGELLPHVFLGDVTRFVITAFECSINRQDMLRLCDGAMRILSLLERAMSSSDEKLQELVSVSFLENLNHTSKTYTQIRARLGPRLLKELQAYE
jgi:hypothetical protein